MIRLWQFSKLAIGNWQFCANKNSGYKPNVQNLTYPVKSPDEEIFHPKKHPIFIKPTLIFDESLLKI